MGQHMKALLDTHILLYWFASRSRLSTSQLEILRQASPTEPLWVSDISLWEIATLYKPEGIRLSLPLHRSLAQPCCLTIKA
jgi:PIN domain nuclease of toxin-antitoxin system